MTEQFEYKNIFDAVTDDKEEALRMKRRADFLLARREASERRMSEFNEMCDLLCSVGGLAIHGDKTNYWAIAHVIDPKGGLPFHIKSGYDNQTAEEAVTALFDVYTKWMDLK